MKSLVVYGAGGHGKVVADAATAIGSWQQIYFYDDSIEKNSDCLGYRVLGTFEDLLQLPKNIDVVVALGSNRLRLEKTQLLLRSGYNVVSILHPTAVISKFATIGRGVVVFAGAVINPDARIGDAVIVNSNSVVEHDCELACGVHISPMASLAGGVSVGECSWVGLNACVIQKINIGCNVVIGAGAAVVNNLPNGATAVGVPAKIIKLSGSTC